MRCERAVAKPADHINFQFVTFSQIVSECVLSRSGFRVLQYRKVMLVREARLMRRDHIHSARVVNGIMKL